jgi:hypothetical protein
MRTQILLEGIFIACACAAIPSSGQENDSLASCFPKRGDIAGWQQQDSLRLFHGKELYLLLDGGADIYLEYGCLGAAAARYADGAGRTVSVELYSMRNPGEAAGLYSFLATSGGSALGLGQEAIRGEYFIFIWKGNTVLSITGMDADSLTQAGVDRIARTIEPCLPLRGVKPDLFGLLERPGFEHEGIMYIRGRLGLANAAAYGQDRLFRPQEGVIGRRGKNQNLIMRFETERDASLATGDALSRAGTMKEMTVLASDKRGFVLRDRQNRTVQALHQGRYLLVAAGPDERSVRQNLESMLAGLSG